MSVAIGCLAIDEVVQDVVLSSIFLAVSTCWYLPDQWLYNRRGVNETLALILRYWRSSTLVAIFCIVLCQRDVDGLLWSTVAAFVAAAPPPPGCWDMKKERNILLL